MNSSAFTTSSTTTPFNVRSTPLWIITITINWILILVSLWFAIALLHYGKRTGKWRLNKTNKLEQLYSGRIYISILLNAFSCLFRLLISQAFFFVGFDQNKPWVCRIEETLSTISYLMVQLSFYFFIWFRQRIFYSHDMLNIGYGNCIKFLSLFSIILILLSASAIAVLPIITKSPNSTQYGCLSEQNTFTSVYWTITASAIIVSYVLLFGLLIYPISSKLECTEAFIKFMPCKKSEKRRSTSRVAIELQNKNSCLEVGKSSLAVTSSFSVDTNIETEEVRKVNRGRRNKKFYSHLKQTIKRTLIFTIPPFTIDTLLLPIIFSNSQPSTGHLLSNFVYDLGAFSHLLLMVMSFIHFKEILFSPCIERINIARTSR